LAVRGVCVNKQALIIVYSEEIADSALDTPYTSGNSPTGSKPQSLSAFTLSYIHVYTINGKPLANRQFSCKVNDFISSSDGTYIVAADERGGISLMLSYRFVSKCKWLNDELLDH
jgi:hypothetical protein